AVGVARVRRRAAVDRPLEVGDEERAEPQAGVEAGPAVGGGAPAGRLARALGLAVEGPRVERTAVGGAGVGRAARRGAAAAAGRERAEGGREETERAGHGLPVTGPRPIPE